MTTIQGLGLSPFFQGLQRAVAPRFGGDIFPLAADDGEERFPLGADAFVPGASPVAGQAYRDGLALLHEGDMVNAAKAFQISLDMGYGHVIPASKIYNNIGVAHARQLQELKRIEGTEKQQGKAFSDAFDAFRTAIRLDAERVKDINEKVVNLDRSRPEAKPNPVPRINAALLLAEDGHPDQAVANLLNLPLESLPDEPELQTFMAHNLGLLMAEMVEREQYEQAAKLRDAGAQIIPDEPGYHYFVSE